MSNNSPTRKNYALRNAVRYILAFFFETLFVSALFVWGPLFSKNPVLFGLFRINNFNWGGFGIFWQFVIIVLLMAFAQLLASLLTLTYPHLMFFLLNVVFGSIALEFVVSILPFFHVDVVTPSDFGVFWIGIIMPTLAIISVLFYLISRPYQKRVVSYVR